VGIKDQEKEFAAVIITFDSSYTSTMYLPQVKSVRPTTNLKQFDAKFHLAPFTLADSYSCCRSGTNPLSDINQNFSDVIVTVIRQFLEKRWASVNHPKKSPLSMLMGSLLRCLTSSMFISLISFHYIRQGIRMGAIIPRLGGCPIWLWLCWRTASLKRNDQAR
jgi:hypothetical protein